MESYQKFDKFIENCVSEILSKFNMKLEFNGIIYRYPQNLETFLHPRDELVICADPLHDSYNNTLRIVEFIELYKLLGATKFYIYNDTISSDVDKVLRYYQKLGYLEVLDWKIEKGEKN